MTIGQTNYPAALDTASELIRAVNRVASTVAAPGVDADDQTIPIANTADVPSDGVCWIEDEAISFTGKTANSLTGCVRGFDGTTPAAHATGATVYFDPILARIHNVLVAAIIAIETKVGAGPGTVVVTGIDGTITIESVFADVVVSAPEGIAFTAASGPVTLTADDELTMEATLITFVDRSDPARRLRVATDSLTEERTINFPDANGFIGIKVAVPSTATDPGGIGMWAADASHFYVCTAPNTWRRVAVASW